MADERLRELERAAAQGDLEAGEQLIRERLRLGQLEEERVCLAAYVGDHAALRVRPDARCDAGLGEWLAGLFRWGRPVSVQAALALAASQAEGDDATRDLLSAVRAWIDRPTNAGARTVVLARTGVLARRALPSSSLLALNAADAVLSDPPEPGDFVANLDPDRCRRAVRSALVAVALEAGVPLSIDVHPPVQPGHSSREWRDIRAELHESFGVRAIASLGLRKVLVWNPTEQRRERITLTDVHGREEEVEQVPGHLEVDHRNVARTFAVATRASTSWGFVISEAVVPGVDLGTWRRQCLPSVARSTQLVTDLCPGVEALRPAVRTVNLCPERVIVRGDGSPVVIDGVAHDIEFRSSQLNEHPQRSSMLGVAYLAPEQLMHTVGPEALGAVAAYQLAAVLYFLIAGAGPFDRESLFATFRAVTRSEPVPPSQHPDVTITPPLEALILRALSKAPQERPRSGPAFVDELRAL